MACEAFGTGGPQGRRSGAATRARAYAARSGIPAACARAARPGLAVRRAVVELPSMRSGAQSASCAAASDRSGLVDLARRAGCIASHDRLDLRRMDAPHAQEAELVAGAAGVGDAPASGSSSARVTSWAGTTPWASAAAATSDFARRTSGWSNCPGDSIAASGNGAMVRATRSRACRSRGDTTPGSAAIAHASCTAPGVSISTVTGIGAREAEARARGVDVREKRSTSPTHSAPSAASRNAMRSPAPPTSTSSSALPAGCMDVVDARADAPDSDCRRSPISAAIICACARSPPTGAPSSQSQAMSNAGPRSRLQRERLAQVALAARRSGRRAAAPAAARSPVVQRLRAGRIRSRIGPGRATGRVSRAGSRRRRALPRAPSA